MPLPPFLRPLYRSEGQWFWTRELLHFMGGLAIGILCTAFRSHSVAAGFAVAVLIGIMVKEVLETVVGTQRKRKATIDFLAWAAGMSVGIVPRFMA
jgi:hypothetical protein